MKQVHQRLEKSICYYTLQTKVTAEKLLRKDVYRQSVSTTSCQYGSTENATT